jgi:hypothetical protein
MEYTGYPVIQFGSFRQNVGCNDAPTPRNTPSSGTPWRTPRRTSQRTPRRTPGNSPRGQYSPRSPVKYNNIQEQLDFANRKYEEVLNKYMKTPCKYITEKQEEDVWAWGLFSEVVLPMLKIVDE